MAELHELINRDSTRSGPVAEVLLHQFTREPVYARWNWRVSGEHRASANRSQGLLERQTIAAHMLADPL